MSLRLAKRKGRTCLTRELIICVQMPPRAVNKQGGKSRAALMYGYDIHTCNGQHSNRLIPKHGRILSYAMQLRHVLTVLPPADSGAGSFPKD